MPSCPAIPARGKHRRRGPLALLAAGSADRAAAARLAATLGLPLLPEGSTAAGCDVVPLLLVVAGGTLALQQSGRPAPGPVAVEFGSAGMRYRRRASHNELLGRAVGTGRRAGLRVLDATAGLGRDSFVLADLDCEVTLCEREPVIAEMLAWGLRAAAVSGDPWLTAVVARMRLLGGDARNLTARELAGVEVIYLDPMFAEPGRRAAAKKEMALFQRLLGSAPDPADDEALLRWALATDAARVVVKRPLRAPPLAGCEPSHALRGRAVRFDVHVRRALEWSG
jgi:16S rRNA (guanine1516-N2)-methyltransferase